MNRKNRVRPFNIPVMRALLEKITEPLQPIEVLHGLPFSSSTVYDAIRILALTGNVRAEVGENIHGRAVVVYSPTPQGRELLPALSVVEKYLT